MLRIQQTLINLLVCERILVAYNKNCISIDIILREIPVKPSLFHTDTDTLTL